MAKNEEWITARAGAKLLGYKNPSNVNDLAHSYNVRTKPGKRKNWFLYHKGDLEKAHEQIDVGFIRNTYTEPGFAKFNTYLKLKAPQLVIADCHCPFVDWVFLDQALRTKDKLGIRRVTLAGDTADCAAQSKFYSIIKVDWEIEKEILQKLLKKLLKEFDEVNILTANHELRYLKRLWVNYNPDIVAEDSGERLDIWQSGLGDLIKDKKLKISIYPYADIGKTWRVCHPSSYRKQPLSFGREQVAITGKSQIVTHAHMSGIGPAPDAKHWIVDCGVFADPLNFPYKNLRVTAHYKWTESFVTIDEDEWPTLYMKGNEKPINAKAG